MLLALCFASAMALAGGGEGAAASSVLVVVVVQPLLLVVLLVVVEVPENDMHLRQRMCVLNNIQAGKKRTEQTSKPARVPSEKVSDVCDVCAHTIHQHRCTEGGGLVGGREART